MKRKVQRSLAVVILLSMIFSLVLYFALQIKLTHNSIVSESETLLYQVDRILSENRTETENVTREFQEESMNKARAAAYFVQNNPKIMDSVEEIKKLAKMLSVDEIHFFDTKGTIIAGSEPKYYGYNFNSGEQMRFFLPLLKNRSLKLCQPITPNTAEGKMMQYAAVWRDDGKGIVQIGIEPDRVLAATRKNELSYIFSLLTINDDSEIYAVNPGSYEILGSTHKMCVGKTMMDIGISEDLLKSSNHFHAKIDGKRIFVVLNDDGKGDILLARTVVAGGIFSHIVLDALLLALYLIVLAMIMYYFISRYIDRTIIQGINGINGKLQSITEGNLAEKVDENSTPEFAELSGHINLMVSSILESADKLSSVLDMADIRIGMFEYRTKDKKMVVTEEVWDILEVPEDKRADMLRDYSAFENGIFHRIEQPVPLKSDIFLLRSEETKYFKMKVFVREDGVFGLLMDVTDDVQERLKIEKERDIDPLTGLFVRRAFRVRALSCFENPDVHKFAALLIMDTDNLKVVNDHYGHLAGDKYLCEISRLISSCSAPEKYTARMSGDEFIQLIYGCDSKEELLKHIHELQECQNGYTVKLSDTVSVPLSFSVGYAIYEEETDNFGELVKLADSRMYENKRQRKMILNK